MHKSNEDELTKRIENFIKKSMMIILNSRIPSSLTDKMHQNFQEKTNSKANFQNFKIFSFLQRKRRELN